MSQRIFVSALIAGGVAGLLAAALQFAFVIPLLLEGELYESGVRVHFQGGIAESISEAPALVWDIGRHGLTVAFNLIAWIGFALILVALMGFAAARGHEVTAKRGAVWGMMAFFAVQLAPAAGLPPELPGTIAAEVSSRYVWWALTIIMATVAFWTISFRRGVSSIAIGSAALLLPHLLGAPHPEMYFGVAPPELSALFVTRSLAVAAVTWITLGAIAGWVWERDAR